MEKHISPTKLLSQHELEMISILTKLCSCTRDIRTVRLVDEIFKRAKDTRLGGKIVYRAIRLSPEDKLALDLLSMTRKTYFETARAVLMVVIVKDS